MAVVVSQSSCPRAASFIARLACVISLGSLAGCDTPKGQTARDQVLEAVPEPPQPKRPKPQQAQGATDRLAAAKVASQPTAATATTNGGNAPGAVTVAGIPLPERATSKVLPGLASLPRRVLPAVNADKLLHADFTPDGGRSLNTQIGTAQFKVSHAAAVLSRSDRVLGEAVRYRGQSHRPSVSQRHRSSSSGAHTTGGARSAQLACRSAGRRWRSRLGSAAGPARQAPLADPWAAICRSS